MKRLAYWQAKLRAAQTEERQRRKAAFLAGIEGIDAILTPTAMTPPTISSGSAIWRRSISAATKVISSSDGVMSPLSPTMSARLSTAACRIFSVVTITPRSITS